MRGSASIMWRRAFRIAIYAVVGWLGLNALAIPLFGYLNFGAALIFPLVFVLTVIGAVRAVTAGGRWAWAYVLGNIGVLAATCVVFVAGLVELSAHWQVDTEVTRPLYLALVLVGLVVGVVVGARMRRPAP